jgi:hypothetical protein
MSVIVSEPVAARDAEALLLARIVLAASGDVMPGNAMEASVFQLAGRLLMPRAPKAGEALVATCTQYFARAGGQPWSVDEITAHGAVVGLSRFRDALFRAFAVAA